MKNKAGIILGFITFIMALTACGSGTDAIESEESIYPKKSVELIAPAGAGSGFDLTARSVANCLLATKLVSVPLPVTNKQGGGGVIALSYLDEKRGADDVISVYSPPLLMVNLNGSTALNYKDNTTPIARLITDYGCFAVSSDSPYRDIGSIMDALKADPTSVRVGGTSAAGSMDHIQFLKIAKAAGVTRLDEIQYFGYEDGGAAAQLMGGHIDVISTGISDAVGLVESGDLRVLAITAAKRVGSGIVYSMPTCIEQGINATFFNWRGLFGPKDMPDYALRYWESIVEQMVQTSEWKDICQKYGWDMDYAGHEDFERFLADCNKEYAALLEDVGLLNVK